MKPAAGGRIQGTGDIAAKANFFLIRVADAPAVFSVLCERGILLRRPGDDPALAGLLRVSTGTPGENKKLVQELEKVIQGN